MNMIVHTEKQGSVGWLNLRAKFDTSSQASAMMGASKNVTRNQLLHMKATCTEQEFSEWVKAHILDRGHEVEAKARPLIEKKYSVQLFPLVGSSHQYGTLLASFDGVQMYGITEYANPALDSFIWECKQWNESKVKHIQDYGTVPPEDHWQVVQQLVVSRASQCIYTVTDGTEARCVSVFVSLNPADEELLVRGWAQFNKDIHSYTPPSQSVEVIAAPIKDLPVINYNISYVPDPANPKKTVLVLKSNMIVFREAANKLLADAKKELHTDQDFADRDSMNKKLRGAEDRLKLLREQVIGEIGDIDKFTRELAEMQEIVRQAAIAGENQVTKRKQVIKQEAIDRAVAEFQQHVIAINASIVPASIPDVFPDFVGAAKNKRTIDSLNNSIDTELSRVKILADQHHDRIAANLAVMRDKVSEDLRRLFLDVKELVLKDAETLLLIINSRIQEHEKAEQKRLDDEREKIREEERLKLLKEQEEAEQLKQAEAAAAELAANPVVVDEVVAPAMGESSNEAQVIGVDLASGPDVSVEHEIKPMVTTYGGGLRSGSALRKPDPIPAVKPITFTVVNMGALIRAAANGEVPLNIFNVDLEALVDYCESTGDVPAGVQAGAECTASNEHRSEPCEVCFSRDCNGECMSDGNG